MLISCIIGDKNHSWEETLAVESLETAEKDIKEIINRFNSDLRPGENPRKLIKILKENVNE